MSRIRIFTSILVVLATVMLATPSRAQHNVPPVINPDGDNPDLWSPYIEPFAFDPDFQFFSQSNLWDRVPAYEPNVGWFATYDRVYIWMSRPEEQTAIGPSPNIPNANTPREKKIADETGGDYTWGNRFDVGYMTEEDHGWLTSFWHIDGPNSFDLQIVERVDVFEDADPAAAGPDVGLRGGSPPAMAAPGSRGIPTRDENNRVTGQRDYLVTNSINVADLTSWEFNKTFRLKQLHYGSYIEPIIGFRYMKYQDYFQRSTYERYSNVTGVALGFDGIPPISPVPTTDVTMFSVEDFQQLNMRTDNYMIGGQLGMRWFKQKARWNLSSEVRALAFQNFQSMESATEVERTYFPDVSPNVAPQTVVYDKDSNAAHAAEFVVGTEVRAQAAYAVTRDVWLRAGMSFMYLGRGIGRGPFFNPSRPDDPNFRLNNQQSVTMVGATFGFTVNR